jgi:cyclic pyranopterin phosphate synthase
MTGLSDSFQRPINYLRVSVTDRCNLRCVYCMPPEGVKSIPHDDILTYEEIYTIVRAASELGIDKVRLTGGEPLVRLGVSNLVRMLAQIKTIDDISMTTNGILLKQHAEELKAAGLNRVNVSLDTLQPEKFKRITRFDRFYDVMEGIEAARSAGLNPVKINVVVMAGVNDDELLDFARKTIDDEWHVRFIEMMPFAGQSVEVPKTISSADIKKLFYQLGKMEPFKHSAGNGPAKYYRFPNARGTVGFISALSEHFCFRCNRLRLTADGQLRPCLMSTAHIDLREPLRQGISPGELKELIRKAVDSKPQNHHLAEGMVPDDRPFCQVGG